MVWLVPNQKRHPSEKIVIIFNVSCFFFCALILIKYSSSASIVCCRPISRALRATACVRARRRAPPNVARRLHDRRRRTSIRDRNRAALVQLYARHVYATKIDCLRASAACERRTRANARGGRRFRVVVDAARVVFSASPAG